MGLGRGFPTTTPAEEALFQPAPFHTLDDKTKSKLEDLRRQTPRYLFRAFKNTHPRMSGGYATLNTPDNIIPLAFRAGRGHSSVYDMSKADLTTMVLKHINYEKQDFLTEFSSWTASLSYAMLFFPNEDTDEVYISITDTALKPHNDIFFVPDLAFLTTRGNLNKMHHEYLAHRPIRGPAHRTVPLRVLLEAGFHLGSLYVPGKKIMDHHPQKVTVSEVRRARSVAEHYGHQFAAPVALALLSLEQRSVPLFLREGDVDLKTVLKGLDGLHIPRKWSQDTTIMEDVAFMGNYFEVRQFIHLMRAIVRHQLRNMPIQNPTNDVNSFTKYEVNSNDAEKEGYGAMVEQQLMPSQDKASAYKWFVRFANGKAKLFKKMQRNFRQKSVTRNVARVVKSGDSRSILKIDTAALERAMKKLDVDMNRYGRKSNGHKNEKETEHGNTEMVLD